MTHSRRRIEELLEEHALRPSRALGQNFVADAGTVKRIARLADVGPGDHVIEVGGGLGSLTLALSETEAHVTSIEIDRYLVPTLRDVVSGSNVDVVEGDALTLDWSLIVPPGKPVVVVANLPYNVGSSIVTRVLEEVPQATRMLVMVQREVGERLVAKVGDDAYGALSVKIRYYADARMRGTVGASVFVPKPKVESALVEITRLATPRVDPLQVDQSDLFSLVRAGFAHRRKMLRRSLSGMVEDGDFECAGISPTSRAEELDVVDWGRLVECGARR